MDTHSSNILKQIHISKIILPVIIGILIVFYLIFKQFDYHEFLKINWNFHVYFWIAVSIILYIFRHLALSARLYNIANGQFSFLKSVELIFIWEFSSAISPTSFGGSAVALFFLSQEKMKTSKTIALVLYTIVLDSFFFLIAVPLFFLSLGPQILRPDLSKNWISDPNVILLTVVYLVTLTYASFMFIGIFVQPMRISKFLTWMSKIKFFNRYKEKFETTGQNFIIASEELKKQNKAFHLSNILFTSIAWAIRFGVVNTLIIAFSSVNLLEFVSQLIIYGRSQSLYILTAYTPTPGSAGFSELLFNGFFKDFVPLGISLIIVIIWRLISYYSYLLAGAIIVPNWINKLMKHRKIDKQNINNRT